jgi:HEAT repeat protein
MPGPFWFEESHFRLAAIIAFLIWAMVALFLLVNRLIYRRRGDLLEEIVRTAQSATEEGSDEADQQIEELLGRSSRRVVYRLVGRTDLPDRVTRRIAAFSIEKWGLERMMRDAASTSGRKWRRISALFALGHMRTAGAHIVLRDALFDRDPEVAGAAATILTRMGDAEAAGILIGGLRVRTYSPARIATHLEQFPIPIVDQLLEIIDDPLPHVRFWAVSLLFRYAGEDRVAEAVLPHLEDSDPTVRKVAAETLGATGSAGYLSVISRRLEDEVPFVRSAAIRAIARITVTVGDPELRRSSARLITPALADRNYDVRLAAKESLINLGSTVWREVAMELRSPDAFARNSAAEVLQDLRLLDRVMEDFESGVITDPELTEIASLAFREGGDAMVRAAIGRLKSETRLDIEQVLAQLRVSA